MITPDKVDHRDYNDEVMLGTSESGSELELPKDNRYSNIESP